MSGAASTKAFWPPEGHAWPRVCMAASAVPYDAVAAQMRERLVAHHSEASARSRCRLAAEGAGASLADKDR